MKLKRKKNTAHLKANSIGCFMLNGVDTIAFPIHTRAEDFCEFLTEVRNRNPLNRICLVLDNFATHKAKSVREWAQKVKRRRRTPLQAGGACEAPPLVN
jgi:hypothetical protein